MQNKFEKGFSLKHKTILSKAWKNQGRLLLQHCHKPVFNKNIDTEFKWHHKPHAVESDACASLSESMSTKRRIIKQSLI